MEGGRTFLRRRDQISPPEGKKEQNRILVVEGVSLCPRCGSEEPTCACLENIQMQPHMGQLLELLLQGDLRECKGDDDALDRRDTVECLALIGAHSLNEDTDQITSVGLRLLHPIS